ncbi:MAG: hypothetical protein BMS9Abin33_1235 [Gammaproteobacteria bacterium]|nr:MAG: hypothetical protein BMS9Abin33_1235 [Gammaproteobacteria bacterium]
MKADPDYEDYLKQWSSLYEKNNYDEGLAGYFLTKSHQWSERHFCSDMHMNRVLEVGAGTGMHVRFVEHSYDEYVITDLNPPLLEKIKVDESKENKIIIKTEDASNLGFPDKSFDRVIAAHVLEHLYRPHEILREWVRVLKPGGILSLVLPCDPGMAWRLGRTISARRKFVKAGMDYDYWMAREHVNAINNLVSLIRFYFEDVHEEWRPSRVPSIDLNLFYIAHIRV